MAARRADQVVHERVSAGHQAFAVDLESSQVFLQRHLFELAAKHHAGVVDQNRDRPELLVNLIAQLGEGAGLAHGVGVKMTVSARRWSGEAVES